MPKINQDLLERLASKLDITRGQVYNRVQEVAAKTMLDRHLAALVFATEQGVNIHKYSTAEERAQIRGSLSPNGQSTRTTVPEPATQTSRRAGTRPKKTGKAKAPKNDTVFVVHGRNEALRKSMFDFLRALGLKPLEWDKALLMAKGANPHIAEILDAAMEKVQAVVVLFSPDDEARLKPEFQTRNDPPAEKKLGGQPRANVIFEAGLALGRHPEKSILVEVGKLRGFTDIAGKHVVRLTNDYGKRNDLANRLQKIGCKVDKQGSDWTSTGDFTA